MSNSLKFTTVRPPESREESFASYNIYNSTYIVSDLAAKNAIQNILLNEHEVLPEDAVLRANEFWRKLLKRHFPQVDVVSRDLIETQMASWLRDHPCELARFKGTAKKLVSYIELFLPVIQNQTGIENLTAWLEAHPASRLRWEEWLRLASDTWQHFRKKNCIPMSWVSGFLASHDIPLLWPRQIIVDLDADLTGIECELFRTLARNQTVEIKVPESNWISRYPQVLKPYQILMDLKDEVSRPPVSGQDSKDLYIKRFSTQLGEVKEAVQFVRQSLDAGVEASQIGILASDIETYWPVLISYLAQEGIPSQKPVAVNAHNLPSISIWLSRLRVELSKISKADIELSSYSDPDLKLKYDSFVKLFSRIYDIEDMKRSEEIHRRYTFQFEPLQMLKRDEFWSWTLKHWTDSDLRALDRIAAELLYECPQGMLMEATNWLHYLERLSSRTEITIRDPDANGIFIGKLETAKSLNLTDVAIIGLSDSGVKDRADVNVSQQDINMIFNDLGYFILPPDRRKREYYTDSRVSECSGKVLLTFPTTGLTGSAESPSQLWMEYAHAKNVDVSEIAIPAETRWDELQKIAGSGSNEVQCYIDRDLGVKDAEPLIFDGNIHFSASQVSNYLKCPFIFASEKIFRLKDAPLVDLDVDHQSRGRLIHKVLENLICDPVRLEWSESEIEKTIDICREKLGIVLGDIKLWPTRRDELVNIIKRVLTFEKEWRQRHPATRTVGNEVRIQGDVEWQGEKFSISGHIDRVDSDGGTEPKYVVIDYKSSANDLRYHGSWLANNDLQLAIYAIAIREGLTDLPPGPVLGAFYYALNNIQRDRGFKLEQGTPVLFDECTRYNKIELDSLDTLLTEVKNIFAGVVRQVRAGEMSPQPKDDKLCNSCTWRTLCRAAHLN